MILRQSSAIDVTIGPFVDSTDGYTPEVGVSPAVKLSKAGQALAAKTNITTPVHDADGYYNCELDATDTNTIGILVLSVVGSATSLAVRHEYQVIEEAAYDAMYASGAAAPLQPTVAGRTLDVTAGGAAGVDWANVENPTTAVDLSGTDIQLCDTVTTNTDMRGTNSALLAASAPTNFGDLAITVTTGLVSVGTNSDKTGYSISGSKTTLDALNDVSTAQVNTEADTALSDVNLDHLVGTAAGIPAVPAGTFFDQMLDDGTAVYDRTTDSLQAISDSGGGGPTAVQIADEVLTRDWTLVTGEAVRSTLNALRFLRNKWSVSGTTLTVTEEDDLTAAWTAVVTTDAAAEPITGSDPN